MVCVKEKGPNKCEIGVFEEDPKSTGTELEENMIQKLGHGLQVVVEEIMKIEGQISKSVALENPWSDLANGIRKRFEDKGGSSVR